MLEINSLSKPFSGRKVLSDFSLLLPEGSFTVLLGPSGCGKSTLFSLLMGTLPSDGGNLYVRGKPYANLRGQAAYMPQKNLLLPWLPLGENALLPVRTRGRPFGADLRKMTELFALLGLTGFEGYYPGEVSGGMAQRCALARTILFEAPAALLDEPLSAVDAITRRSLRELLLLLQSRSRKTILLATHDVDDALILADRVFLLSPLPMKVIREIPMKGTKPRDPLSDELLKIKVDILFHLEGKKK
ncbi:MAG: ABC transporter ATP-binding protein [Synergistaceae bacterium]|nr:ABC transporter ATP-binding protein [Synergistaceae bacterium]